MLDVQWLNDEGQQMRTDQWSQNGDGVFAQFLGAHNDQEQDLLIVFNPDVKSHRFVMPEGHWTMVLDTNQADGQPWRANSPEGEVDETMTQIMRMGLAVKKISKLRAPVVKCKTQDATSMDVPAAKPKGTAARTLHPHSVYMFVARRKG